MTATIPFFDLPSFVFSLLRFSMGNDRPASQIAHTPICIFPSRENREWISCSWPMVSFESHGDAMSRLSIHIRCEMFPMTFYRCMCVLDNRRNLWALLPLRLQVLRNLSFPSQPLGQGFPHSTSVLTLALHPAEGCNPLLASVAS